MSATGRTCLCRYVGSPCESMTENLSVDIEWVVVGGGHGVGDPQCRKADPRDRRSLTDDACWGINMEDLASAGMGVNGLGVDLEGLTQVTDQTGT